MQVEVKMPKLGLTMESGTVARWLKSPGDAVQQGEPVVEIVTDKVEYEVEAPASGRLASVRAQEEDEVPVGGVLGLIDAAD